MTFSSIDPARMRVANDAVQSAGDSLQRNVGGLRHDCELQGIGYSELQEIANIGRWAAGQLPSLRRRQKLAEALTAQQGHIANGQFAEGLMVEVPDDFLSADQANGKGSALADKIKHELETDGKLSPETLAELMANSYDPDYMKGLYDKLGPDGLCRAIDFAMKSDYYQDHPDDADRLSQALGQGLATYSRTTKLDNAWLDKFAVPRDMMGSGQFAASHLAFIMRGAHGSNYDAGFLTAIGNRMFAVEMGGGGEWIHGISVGRWNGDAYLQFTKTISENSLASAHVLDESFDKVFSASTTFSGVPPERQEALAFLVKSGTLLAHDVDPALADKNVEHLIYALHNQPPDEHGFPAMLAVYGQIAHQYFPDMAYGVTNLTPGALGLHDENGKPLTKWDEKAWGRSADGRPGLELPPDLWGSLMEEGLRDPSSAVQLSADFQLYVESDIENRSTSKRSNNNSIGIQSHQAGLMQQFYTQHFDATVEAMGGEIDAWAESVNGFRDSGVDLAIVAAAAVVNPAAGVATAVEEGKGWVTDTAKEESTNKLKDWLHVDPKDAPAGLRNPFDALTKSEYDTAWSSNYTTYADKALEGGISPVTVTKDGATTTYDGDPHKYIKNPAENFLVKGADGKESIQDVGKMTPQQVQAYNRWLTDPAVSAQVYDNGFRDQEAGKGAK